jgi:cytochrome c biogenesis protein CcdA
MTGIELGRWDLPYRLCRPVFIPAGGLNALLPALLVLAVNLFDLFVLVPADGGAITRDNAVSLPVSLIVAPAVAAVYFWIPDTVADAMRRLRDGGMLDGAAVDGELAAMRRRQSSPVLPALALLVAAGLTVASIAGLREGVPGYANESHGTRAIFSYVLVAGIYYAGAMAIFRGLDVSYLIARLAGAQVDSSIDPDHVDGAGGWGLLGSYLLGQLLAVASGVAAAAVILYTHTMKESWQQLLLTAGLLVAALALVGVPLWLVHTMMRSVRRAAMAEIRARRATEHKALRAAVTLVDEEAAITPRLDALRALDEAERRVRRRHPVVPFGRPALLTLNTVTTVSVVLGTTSTAVAFVRTLSG